MDKDSMFIAFLCAVVSMAAIGGCTYNLAKSNEQNTEIRLTCIKEGGQHISGQCVRVVR